MYNTEAVSDICYMCWYVISVYLSEAVIHKCIKAVNDICYTKAVNDITNTVFSDTCFKVSVG